MSIIIDNIMKNNIISYMDFDLEKKLIEFGLKEKEVKIYLIIIKEQRITPLELSRKTELKRPTIYNIADELIKKGLIEIDFTSKNTYYIALSVEQIFKIIEKEKKELSRKEQKSKEIVLSLQKLPKRKEEESISTRAVFGNKEVLDFLKKRSFVWAKSCIETGDKKWWGFQSSDLIDRKDFKKWTVFFWKNIASKGIEFKLLINISNFEEKFGNRIKGRKAKLFNRVNFKTTQIISGDFVINITIKNEELYLIEIEDKKTAESLREMFKIMYSL